jgi:NhaA family Na+:H+ antiporter
MKRTVKKTIKKIYNAELFNEFLTTSSGLVLIACTLISLILANSILGVNNISTLGINLWRKLRILD